MQLECVPLIPLPACKLQMRNLKNKPAIFFLQDADSLSSFYDKLQKKNYIFIFTVHLRLFLEYKMKYLKYLILNGFYIYSFFHYLKLSLKLYPAHECWFSVGVHGLWYRYWNYIHLLIAYFGKLKCISFLGLRFLNSSTYKYNTANNHE